MPDLIIRRPEGLYCPAGDFYIDPWRPVTRALITHAHADHARAGHAHYLAHSAAHGVMRSRLGAISFQGLSYGERLQIGSSTVSLHPAGHVLGSAQVLVEVTGERWVASGDYFLSGAQDKFIDNDRTQISAKNWTCDPFEPVRCDCFITESTFGLPIYQWRSQAETFAQINQWWAQAAANQQNALLLAYSFGKSQRLLAGLDTSIGPIYLHSATYELTQAYRAAGVNLPPAKLLAGLPKTREAAKLPPGALVIAPPAVQGSQWTKQLGEHSDAFASGWMQLRGARRRRGVDRGFVLSDHADWPGLLRAIAATQAARVIVTHGYADVLVRWLREQGLEASNFDTEYGDELADDKASAGSPAVVSEAVPDTTPAAASVEMPGS